MRRGIHVLLFFTMIFTAAIGAATAQDASPEASADGTSLLAGLGYPELTLTTDGVTLDVPAEIEAGRYHVTFTNTATDVSADLELYQLPEGVTTDDLLAAFETGELPEWFFNIVSNGGATAGPGETSEAILDFTPGEWVFNVYTYNDDFTTNVNTPTTVTVTGEMPAVEDPEAAVEASMIDFDFELSEPVPSGANVWKISNDGEQPHHMILMQVPDGTTEEQVVDLAMSFAGPPASPEAAASPVPAGLSEEDVVEVYWTPILSAGQAMWVEVDLEPGTYAAICFIPAPDGTPHVMLGMVEIFSVD